MRSTRPLRTACLLLSLGTCPFNYLSSHSAHAAEPATAPPLKGAAASLGALPLAAVAHSMEHAVEGDQPAQALTVLPALRAEFQLACAALVAWAAAPE